MIGALMTLILGYPVAYLLATSPQKTASILMIFVLLPFFEPLVLIWAVVANAVGAKRALRAAPSLTFLAGVFMFLLLNLGSTQQYGMQPVYALIWTLGVRYGGST